MNVQYNSAAPKETVSLGAGPPQVERGTVIGKVLVALTNWSQPIDETPFGPSLLECWVLKQYQTVIVIIIVTD